jgi:prephenate dehydrogenase
VVRAPLVERAAIVGVGLIGGSLGLRWRQAGVVGRVVGYSRTPEHLRRAVELGAVDEGAPDLAAAVREADLVVLGVPVLAAVRLAPELARLVRPGALLTDVGSTKGAVAQAMRQALAARTDPGPAPVFVGGHPMAGAERTGVEAADPYLFEQAVWVLCPEPGTPAWAWDTLVRLVEATGAHPLRMDPEAHDERVAHVSHLPQLVAVALAEAAGAADEALGGVLGLAGGGFRDTTRIASSPPDFWLDVLDTNRARVLASVERFQAVLDALREAVAAGDREALAEHFARARIARSRVPARQKGLLPAYHDVVVFVPDRPGVLGRLCGALGDHGVNIQDIEILRLREGEGGTLRLGFATAGEAAAARAVLQGLGYEPRP